MRLDLLPVVFPPLSLLLLLQRLPTDPGRQSPHTALLVLEQLPLWKRLIRPQSRQGLHFCRLRSSLKRLLRQGTHRAPSP